MNNATSTIIKALVNGVACWLIVAIIMHIKQDSISIAQALKSYEPILVGVVAVVSSYIGFRRKSNR